MKNKLSYALSVQKFRREHVKCYEDLGSRKLSDDFSIDDLPLAADYLNRKLLNGLASGH
jgi:hypothetical protein